MSYPGNDANELQTAKEQLKSCLHMLQNASSDNEKMAALLLFTHLMKTNQELTVDLNQLFKAVDVKFLVRLLNSSNVPEGCPEFMYKSLALNILSSFTDTDVLFHPLLISNLGSIAEVLSMGRSPTETAQIFDDSVAILLVFSRSANGCNHLLNSKCIPLICKAVIQNLEDDKLFETLRGILFHIPQHLWRKYCSELAEISMFFSTQFAENQELLKFATCEKLLALLSSFCESQVDVTCTEIFSPKLKDNVKKGLNDILQARCKVEYKYTALKLTRVMVDLVGIEWTVVNTNKTSVLDVSNTKFLLLVLSIIQTEIRLILESGQIDSTSDLIVSCYVITEKTIEFLICDKEQNWSFSNEVIMKIHGLLTEMFDCVIQFLIQHDSQDATGSTPCFQQPIVIATVRVLCVWLSEETNALGDKISQVLPVLLKWAKLGQTNTGEDRHPTETPNEILLHLLPPLCHLSADESFCAILVQEDCHVLLAPLFKQLWQAQEKEKAEYPSNLITLCNIFLNFTVLEVELAKSSNVFEDILVVIMTAVPKMLNSNCTTLTAHFGLLGLIIFRHRFKLNNPALTVIQSDFMSNIISFLKQIHLSVSTDDSNACHWKDISELWFLSVQNMVACGKTAQPIKQLILRSKWPKEIQEWMDSCKQTSNNLVQDLKSALLPLANLE